MLQSHCRRQWQTLKACLNPVGYLLILEGTNRDIIQASFVFAGFEGWWLGENDGRVWGPMVTTTEWDRLLKKTGFSGVETITPKSESRCRLMSVFVSQAVDDNISLLQDPLTPVPVAPHHGNLVIIGVRLTHLHIL